MKSVESLAEIQEHIANEPFVLAYLSRPDCGVCVSLKPKVIEIVEEFSDATAYYVDLDAIPEAAGEYSIFTIPGILVFVDGKESIREARYVSVDQLVDRMERLHALRFAS